MADGLENFFDFFDPESLDRPAEPGRDVAAERLRIGQALRSPGLPRDL